MAPDSGAPRAALRPSRAEQGDGAGALETGRPRGDAAPMPTARLSIEPLELELANPWTIARGTSSRKRNGVLRLEADGATGFGELAPNARYQQSYEGAAAAFERLRAACAGLDPLRPREWIALAENLVGPESELTAALDAALWDWRGKRTGKPVSVLAGAANDTIPITSFSIGIADVETMRRKAREAPAGATLKLKVGLGDDATNVAAVRAAAPGVALRADANEGWRDRESALAALIQLHGLGVEFVEQPMPAADRDAQRWLFERSPLPLVADEASLTAADVPGLRGLFHGINVKLSKCGGITRALEMHEAARRCGLKTMIGCMIESSLGIAAAVAIASKFDWVDLDGNLLLAADPFEGLRLEAGRWRLPTEPGLGVRPH